MGDKMKNILLLGCFSLLLLPGCWRSNPTAKQTDSEADAKDRGIEKGTDLDTDTDVDADSGIDTNTHTDTDIKVDIDSDDDPDTDTDTPEDEECGDGETTGSEECDDANDVAEDGCHKCKIAPILVDSGDSTRRVFEPQVALLPNGGFALAWLANENSENPLDTTVYLKLFDDKGAARGDDILVEDMTMGDVVITESLWDLALATSSDGKIIIIWSRLDERSFDGRIYNRNGEPLTDPFKLNSLSTADYAEVAMASDGSFVVVWSTILDDSDLAVYAKQYDVTGAPQDDEYRINGPTWSWNVTNVTVDLDDNGNFIAAWHIALDKSSVNIGIRLSSDGTTIETPDVNWGSSYASLVVAPDGRFAIGFSDIYGQEAFARAYHANGQGMAPYFMIDSDVYDTWTYSMFIGLNRENHIYVFGSPEYVPGVNAICPGRRFDFEGNPIGDDFSYVNLEPTETFVSADMDMSPSGAFVIGYNIMISDDSGNPIDTSVYAQRFRSDGTKIEITN